MSEGTLHVRDSRTSREYAIPIRHNSIAAGDIKKIKGNVQGSNPADKVANGLRVYDPALSNTAIIESNMTWMQVLPISIRTLQGN
jgi:citrate synthase